MLMMKKLRTVLWVGAIALLNQSWAIAEHTPNITIITIPPDLNPGDPYHLVFVTAGDRDASSESISEYDNFVKSEAEASASLLALGTNWMAIASAWSDPDSLGNINMRAPVDIPISAPIYNLNGERVADGASGLFDGNIDAPIRYTQYGRDLDEPGINGFPVFTGSASDGSVEPFYRLGANVNSNTGARCGYADYTTGWWLSADVCVRSYTTRSSFYGISAQLIVPAPTDTDNDGVNDDTDNCPAIANPDQTDNDNDGTGDVCDDDDDNDGVLDGADNCPLVANASQANADGDALGDACDGDLDGDGVDNEVDNCPAAANLDQTNTDNDGAGDECDSNDDNDNWVDAQDNCPTVYQEDQEDLDRDDIGDACDADLDGDGFDNEVDNCPVDANAGQDNTDGDAYGDACDLDDDADGVPDVTDNCPLVVNPNQENFDGDADGDACDTDLDGDGASNQIDNCPLVANSAQGDLDGDGEGDACDTDIDGDGIDNDADNCAATPFGEATDDSGCTIAQLCPCDGPKGTTLSWKNHGKYVSCVAHVANDWRDAGLISDSEHGYIVSAVGGSQCGVK